MSVHDPRLAGVPPELRAPLVEMIAGEPRHHPAVPVLDRRRRDRRRFTLRELVRPVRRGLLGAVALVAFESLMLQAGPLMVRHAIDAGIAVGNLAAVAWAAALYAVAAVIGAGASAARIRWTGRLGQHLLLDLRVRVFTQFQRLSQAYFTDERVGRLLTRMTSDIEALGQLLQDGIVNLLVQLFTLVAVSGFMLWLDVRLAAIVLLAVGPASVALTWWFRRASGRRYGVVRDRLADLLADLQENLAGARVVTATSRQRHNARTHRAALGEHRAAQIAAGNVQATYGPSIEVVGRLGHVVVLAAGGSMVLAGTLSVGELTAFVLYLTAFFAPIQALVNLYDSYQSGQAAVAKLADVLALEPTVADRDDARELTEVRGRLTFEDVTFTYGDEPALKQVRLDVRPGETVAVVGETGAGKSTLAKLLTRTYDPTSGRILLDGVDVRELTLTSLRRAIGVVPQEPFLFRGTVRDNLTLGRTDLSDERLAQVAHDLGLSQLLDRLGGLDGHIGERGTGLSAGERQLLALARALAPSPRLLILDEATSSLDPGSERIADATLDLALQGRTAVIVAHRLSTAARADRVVVLADGRVVETGPHAQLVRAGGEYARMFAAWERTHQPV